MAEPPGEIGVENQGPWGRHGIVGTSGTNRVKGEQGAVKNAVWGLKCPYSGFFSFFD